ncbi:MAG: family 78 glycoside hydrolase catalytic domain [Armatimonadetes bacterium]|nr:family 78 glycoside hydrolase catalytic domain [Armatimonadota bacterium]
MARRWETGSAIPDTRISINGCSYDVTHQLKQGTNAIGAILGTGWFDTHDQATWNFDKAPWRGQPRMRLVLVLDYKDGRTEQVTSDGTWKTSAGPILVDGIYTGEVYDARKEIPGWDRAGYDDSSWSPAKVVEAPRGALSGMQCPPIIIGQSFKPKTISEPKPGVYILDFGQNFSGHVRLKVKGSAGDKVTMRYSERLDDTGMIQRKEIDVYMTKATPPQPFQTDVYILKGGALESWEQRFSYAGFRYVEVTGFPGKPTLENFEGRFAHTDLASAGEFECSHPLLNQIQHATKWAYLSNAQSIPTDCPQREKNGWTGDAHLACEAGLMNFRSAPFYTKWLDDYADDQKADGRFSLIIPSGGWGAGACHPSWDSAFAIIAEDLHEYLGDARLLEKHYDHLKRYVDYLEGQLKDDVIPFDSLGDWLPWETQTPSQLTSSAMVVVDAEIVSKAAKMLGKAEEAAKYSALATRVRTGIDRKFYEPATLDSLSQTALSVGLYFKLIDPAHRQAAFGALVRNVERQGHIDTGIIGAKFILRVLSEAGRTDLAYKIVARTEQPGWGWWMEQRATTLWEDWKGESSLNHIMFGDVSNWFMQWIAGIGLDPSSPAFKHILIRPQPVGDLTWAKAHHDSPYGRISSSWKKTHGAFHLEIEIPANTSATVTVPGKVAKAEGAILVRSEAEVTVFEVGSGKYVFDAKM